MNFGDIATFPTRGEDWVETVLIGGVVALAGAFLFVPIFAVYGYMMEVMRGAVEGDTEPPQFEDWGDLFVDGVKAYVVLFVYQVPAMIVGGSLMLVFAIVGVGADSGAIAGAGVLFGALAWGVLAMIAGYLSFAAIVNVAVEDSLGAAFDVEMLKTVALSADWFLAWVFYLALTMAAGLASILIITYPFAFFYAISASGRAFGEAFAEATGGRTVPAETPAAEPA